MRVGYKERQDCREHSIAPMQDLTELLGCGDYRLARKGIVPQSSRGFQYDKAELITTEILTSLGSFVRIKVS